MSRLADTCRAIGRGTSARRVLRLGTDLVVLAAVSAALGVLLHIDAARDIVADGVWNAVPGATADGEAAYWYLAAGFLLMPLAGATHRLERTGAPSRGRVGIGIVALGVGGVIAKPASPFWVFVGIGLLLVLRTPEASAARPAAGRALGVIAIVHVLAVEAFYADGVEAIVRGGVAPTVGRSGAEPDALFWWLVTAGMLAVLGEAVRAGTHSPGGRSDATG